MYTPFLVSSLTSKGFFLCIWVFLAVSHHYLFLNNEIVPSFGLFLQCAGYFSCWKSLPRYHLSVKHRGRYSDVMFFWSFCL